MIDLKSLGQERLEEMYGAASVVSETMRVMQKSGTNVVSEILKTTDKFTEWEHVPPKDVYDRESHSQYYYHTHSKSEDGTGVHDDEHGHFHTFLRGKGMPDAVTPAALDDYDSKMDISDVNAHIIGIGMDAMGTPIRLFTVNRWVCGDVWYSGEDIIKMLDSYEVDHVHPSWPVNLWVGNMIALYRPQIEALLLRRDEQVAQWRSEVPDENVFENRDFEVASYLDINLAQDIEALEGVLEI